MKSGFHRLSKEVYFKDPCPKPSLRAGLAHTILNETPSIAWAYYKGLRQRDPTHAMERGTEIESILGIGDTELVCLPHELPNSKGVVVETNDEIRLDSAKEWVASQKAAGKQVIRRHELEEYKVTADAIKENLWKRYRFEFKGVSQLTAIWESNAVWCRAKLDHSDNPMLYDLKICETANPDTFASKMDRYGYDIQHAAYLDGCSTILPDLAGRLKLYFIVAEPHPPYEVVMIRPDAEARALGDLKWARAKQIWGDCLESGDFWGYDRGGQVIEVAAKPWTVAKHMEETTDVAA